MATKKTKKKTAKKQAPYARLAAFARKFPEAVEEHPWGETAIKVRGRIFVFLGQRQDGFGLTVKLPHSREFALEYPFTRPASYGLGKSGWVSAEFTAKDKPPLDVLEAWIAESYRTIAPKKLVAAMDNSKA